MLSSVSRATPHSRPRSLGVVYRLLPVYSVGPPSTPPPSFVLTVGKVGQRRIEAVSNPEKNRNALYYSCWPPLAALVTLVIFLCCCCFVDVGRASHFPSTRLVHNYITTRRVHSFGKYPGNTRGRLLYHLVFQERFSGTGQQRG